MMATANPEITSTVEQQETATGRQSPTGSHPDCNPDHDPSSPCGTWDLPGIDPKPSDTPCDCKKPPPSLPPEKLDALKIGLDAYDKLPPSIRECAFETRFDTCDNESVLDPHFLFKVWLNEAIHLGRASIFDTKDGELGIGKVRPWERSFPVDPDVHTPNIQTAPWPWICQVNPGAGGRGWYKNTEVTKPGNLPLDFVTDPRGFRWEDQEFSEVCVQIPDPGDSSKFTFDCHKERPIGFNSCQGNIRYNFPDPSGTVCLTVPQTFPGQGISLRGLNFISPNCKARLRRIGGGFQDLVLDCGVMSDTKTPLMRDGKVVASCEVSDIITSERHTLRAEARTRTHRVCQ